MLIGLLDAYLPAYTDRYGFWTLDGDAIRWLGVVLWWRDGTPCPTPLIVVPTGVALQQAQNRLLAGRRGPIEAHDRKGPESQGQRRRLLGARRMQRLAWASRGEQVVYSLSKPGAARANRALSLAPSQLLDRLAAAVVPPRAGIVIGITARSPLTPPPVPQGPPVLGSRWWDPSLSGGRSRLSKPRPPGVLPFEKDFHPDACTHPGKLHPSMSSTSG